MALISLTVLLTLAIPLVCYLARPKSRAVMAGATAALAASCALGFVGYTHELHRIDLPQQQFPFESVAARLDDETNRVTMAGNVESSLAEMASSPELSGRLAQFESRQVSIGREDRLRQLHERTAAEFVAAQDFGLRRMVPPMPRTWVELDLPLAASEAYSHDPSGHASPDPALLNSNYLAGSTIEKPSAAALLDMHTAELMDFFNLDPMGYARDREHVAGFQSHHFTQIPRPAAEEGQQARWRVARLELVSLLRHDTPLVYISKNLPRKNELAEAPTRPLDGFEQRALDFLRTAEDVVIDEQPERIQMVGSLRAGHDCLACHTVQRGELLGALSYELVPTVKAKQNQPAEPQVRLDGAITVAQSP